MTLRSIVSNGLRQENENFLVHDPSWQTFKQFEEEYIAIRKKEGRVYDDATLMRLPAFTGAKELEKEWSIRKRSCERLITYLRTKKRMLNILELGCGNGWLAAKIALTLKSQVVGIDINKFELEQASRTFRNIDNVTFIYGDLFQLEITKGIFDIVVIPSAIQYFSDPNKLLHRLMPMLNAAGEIHIIDSPFYSKEEMQKAKARSTNYFGNRASKMDGFYFHHTWDILQNFKSDRMDNPSLISRVFLRLTSMHSRFPWIRIRK